MITDGRVLRGAAVRDTPRASIIIPSFRTAEYIRDTMESVFAQTYTDYEPIVINDGSPDTEELERVLAPYLDRIVYIRQANRGLAGARNSGIRAARGEFIALLDSDDVWEPDYLQVQMAEMERDTSIDVLYPNAVIFGDHPDAGKLSMDVSPSEGEVTFERLVRQECNVRVFVTARREIVMRAGLFDESLRSSEDFDLWLRILKQGGHIAYHRRPLVRYRRRATSLSADPIWMAQHILRVLDKAEGTLALTESEREAVLAARLRFQALLRLVEGKKAFFRGDFPMAIRNLRQSNAYFCSGKIAFVVLLLRLSPRLLLRAYTARDRLVFRVSTRF